MDLTEYSHRLDDHGALKPNLLFWICIILQLKIVVLTALHLFLIQNKIDLLQQFTGIKSWLAGYFLASLPALIILIVYWLRRPAARPLFVFLWQRGIELLTLGFVGKVILDLLRFNEYGLRFDSLSIFFLILNAWLMFLVPSSAYLKALFTSFPQKD